LNPRRRRRLTEAPVFPGPPASSKARGRSTSAPARSIPRAQAAAHQLPTACRVAAYTTRAGRVSGAAGSGAAPRRSAPTHARPGRAQPGPRIEAINPSTSPRAGRRDAEAGQRGRAPMIEDGVAMCEFLRVVRGGPGRPVAAHADHRADDRREARRGARAPARLRRAELSRRTSLLSLFN
jgi:hypothetical protein